MTTRLLPPDEWHRLIGTEAEAVIPHLADLRAQALVVEESDAIIGCWVFLPMWHAECLWISEAHRGHGSVGRRLLSGLKHVADSLGVDRIWTGSASNEVRDLLKHFGAVQIPGEHFVMSLKGR